MSFLIKDDKLLEKWNIILENVSNNIKKEFDCEPVNLYIMQNIRKLKQNFLRDKSTHIFTVMNHQGSQSICLSVILIDSAFRNRIKNSKNYFFQVFLEEYKYITKEKEDV